jgi:hypothetical protein
MKFEDIQTMDNGNRIESFWEMGFYDFDIEYIIKYINKIWIALKPESKSSLTIEWESNKGSKIFDYLDFNNIDFNNFTFNGMEETIGYNLFDYGAINYRRWTYNTNRHPQIFRVKMKVKKFTFFKLVLRNSSLHSVATVLSINFLTRYGSQSK